MWTIKFIVATTAKNDLPSIVWSRWGLERWGVVEFEEGGSINLHQQAWYRVCEVSTK